MFKNVSQDLIFFHIKKKNLNKEAQHINWIKKVLIQAMYSKMQTCMSFKNREKYQQRFYIFYFFTSLLFYLKKENSFFSQKNK